MYKLLNANFERVKKNKLFWGIIIITILFASFMVVTQYSDMTKYNDVIETYQLMVNFLPYIGVIIAIFVSFFVGREYSDGTIRNKIVAGHKRFNIYISDVIINIIVGIIIYTVFMIVIAIIGMPLFGGVNISMSKFCITIVNIVMIIVVYSSIFNIIALNSSNKTTTSVVSILIAFGLMVVSLTLLNILAEQEYIHEGSVTNSETMEMEFITVPNPKYPSELKRKISKTILDVIPTGQAFEIAGRMDTNLLILPLYSLGLIIIFNGVGLYLFERKEIK